MNAPRLYFAYGSNLDSADLDRWLTAQGASNPLAHPVAPALLPDHRYAYHFYSGWRGGGVLDVVRAVGHAVAGMLFEVVDEGWETLDHKEGVPFAYERNEVTVVLADGGLAQALTYQVVGARRDPSGYVEPTAAYHDAVLQGLARHRLRGADALECARRGVVPESIVPQVFVYGTLLHGEARRPYLAGAGEPTDSVNASTRGLLYEIHGADYPALQIDARATSRVRGELCHSDDIARLLVRLDEVEGFGGYAGADNLYERTVVTVQASRPEGMKTELAWTYVMTDAHTKGSLLEHGDWRGRPRA